MVGFVSRAIKAMTGLVIEGNRVSSLPLLSNTFQSNLNFFVLTREVSALALRTVQLWLSEACVWCSWGHLLSSLLHFNFPCKSCLCLPTKEHLEEMEKALTVLLTKCYNSKNLDGLKSKLERWSLKTTHFLFQQKVTINYTSHLNLFNKSTSSLGQSRAVKRTP